MSITTPPTAVRRNKDLGYGRTSRQYEIPGGGCYDSVTSILSAISKPALITWAANLERTYCLEAAADFYECVPLGAERMSRAAFIASLDTRLGKARAHQKALSKAGDIGSQAHALIEWNLRRELGEVVGVQPEVSPEAAQAFSCYEVWRRETHMKPLAIEQVVWSREAEYAGTLDLYAELANPLTGEVVKAIVDWKTGKAIYPEAHLQSAAYINALCEMKHATPPVWGVIVRLPKTPGDPGFEVAWISPDEQKENFISFLSVKDVWDWQQRVRS